MNYRTNFFTEYALQILKRSLVKAGNRSKPIAYYLGPTPFPIRLLPLCLNRDTGHSEFFETEHILKRNVPRFFRSHCKLGGLLANGRTQEQVLSLQPVNISQSLHDALIDKLINQRFPNVINVHHTARREVQDATSKPGRAVDIDATVVNFAFGAHNRCPALRAFLFHVKQLISARMLFITDDLHHFWNHIAAALDLDPVTDLHAQ